MCICAMHPLKHRLFNCFRPGNLMTNIDIPDNLDWANQEVPRNEQDNPIVEVAIAQDNDGTDAISADVATDKIDFEQYEKTIIEVNGRNLSLTAALEVLLFVSDNSVEVSYLTKTLALNSEVIYGALKTLNHQYCQRNSGLRVQEHNGRFQLVTHPYLATLIETYLSLDLTTKLSAPALETLAIIAYRQPVTRAQIEAVRGVDSSGILRSLLQRGLVEEAGRLEGVGRPILYMVTEEFMHHFGLTGLDELPPLETTDADTLWVTTKLAELEEAGNNGREALLL